MTKIDKKELEYRERMKEIKESGPSVYSEDPETGVILPNPTAKSFGPYTNEDVDRWVKEGKIPKKLADAHHRHMKKSYENYQKHKNLKARGASGDEICQAIFEEDLADPEKYRKEVLEYSEFHDFLLENKEKITEILSDHERKTVRYSEDLIREKLDVGPEDRQLDLFEDKNLKERVTNRELAIAGLDFTPAQDNVIHTLITLLSKKSEVWDQDSPDFYMGNSEKKILKSEGKEFESASITCKPIEFYEAYTRRDPKKISGKDIKEIQEAIGDIAGVNYLVTLTVEKEVNGKTLYDTVKTYLPLFRFIRSRNNARSKKEAENAETSKEEAFEFRFHPIFTNNIRNRYIEFPEDIHARMREACGSSRGIAKSTNLLRDLLFREKKNKRYKVVRDFDTLVQVLRLQNDRKRKGPKFVKERIAKDLEISRNLGLVSEWKEQTGKGGQDQYKIIINKDFT